MDDFSLELVKDFLIESYDLLDAYEKSLLVLEKNPSDDKAINEIFRAAHTIKGGAGTVGFNEIMELTHNIEDVLDLVRKKKLQLKTDDVSLLLQCRDELEKMLNARVRNETYTNAIIEEIKERLRIMKEVSIPPAKKEEIKREEVKEKSIEKTLVKEAEIQREIKHSKVTGLLITPEDIVVRTKITDYEISLIADLMSKGRNIYVIKYRLNEKYEMKDVSAFQIYALLNDVSEILKIYPSIEDLEKTFYPEVLFMINTDKGEDYIKDKTELKEMILSMSILKLNADLMREIENEMRRKSMEDFLVKEKKTEKEEEVFEEKGLEELEEKKEEKKIEVKEEQSLKQKEVAEAEMQKRSMATLRVESWKVDELLNLLGELVISKASFQQISADFENISEGIKSSLIEFINGVRRLNLSEDEETSKVKNEVLQDTLLKLFDTIEEYSETLQKFNRISSSLQENVMDMRMVPVQMIFSRFPRLVRDMADKLGKKIDLVIEGVETEIDKGMVDDIFDPLIHILRNSVDHGIELPEERIQSGKPPVGKVILKAIHEGDSISIEVTDDGKGIDVELIKQKAIESNILTKEAAKVITQKELMDLIFIPGFSTASKVTDWSGRGVGMDVVKKKIEEIGGSVAVSTVKGKGTKISIRLPLTLAIIQGLLIRVKSMYYAIPIAMVEETVIIDKKDLKEINGRLAFELREKLVPVLLLTKYFYNEDVEKAGESKMYCIVARYGENYVGILVNDVIGEQDIVIKSLNTKLIKSPGISAATIIGNGEIGFIIDTSQIISQYYKVAEL